MNLTDLVGAARCLLIDFDGPICSVFAGHPAAVIAEELHAVIRRHLGGDPPLAVAEFHANPLQTLVAVAELGDEDLTRKVADACRDGEITASATATPTPGAEAVLRAAHDAGLRVAIVSNNAADAIDAYLKRFNLGRYVDGLAARTRGMHPRHLKPHPFLLERGITAAGAHRDGALFVGDSVTDIEAGRAAGVPTIGYANKLGKHQRLTDAGAHLVIESMYTLADTLHQTTARPTR